MLKSSGMKKQESAPEMLIFPRNNHAGSLSRNNASNISNGVGAVSNDVVFVEKNEGKSFAKEGGLKKRVYGNLVNNNIVLLIII